MNNHQSAQTAPCAAFASLLKASLLIAVLVTLAASSGCRSGQPYGGYNGAYNGPQGYNPAYNPGYNPAAYNQGGYAPAGSGARTVAPNGFNGGSASRTNAAGAASLARNSATIAPPPTYSLNIPGGGVNPYAQGTRVGQLPTGLINTRQAAPTPASGSAGGGFNSPANFNQNQGWRQINGGSLNTQSNVANPSANSQVATSVLDRSGSSTSAPVPQPNQSQQPNPFQQASAARTPEPVNRPQFNNVATTRSTDYQTTSVDERQDPTRLPVTDASGINTRVAQGFIAPAPQPYYNRQQGAQQFQQPQLAANTSQPNTNFQGQFVQPVNSAYQFNNPVGSVGGQFVAPVSQPQLVQSQSTAFYDPFTATASDTQNSGSDSRSY